MLFSLRVLEPSYVFVPKLLINRSTYIYGLVERSMNHAGFQKFYLTFIFSYLFDILFVPSDSQIVLQSLKLYDSIGTQIYYKIVHNFRINLDPVYPCMILSIFVFYLYIMGLQNNPNFNTDAITSCSLSLKKNLRNAFLTLILIYNYYNYYNIYFHINSVADEDYFVMRRVVCALYGFYKCEIK